MRFASLRVADRDILALDRDGVLYDLSAADPSLGTDVGALIESGADWAERAAKAAAKAEPIAGEASYRPVIPRPGKLLCMGLNDVDHAAEAGLPIPDYPVLFARVASSLIGHGDPLLRPIESDKLDFEVELAVVIGTGGRRISEEDALDHVAGYTVFNDGSVRDFQTRTPQWTIGKNFHGTGALGPVLVTTDELPPGAAPLKMTTTVDGEQLQNGNTGAMVFSVARTIALLSEAVVFEPGDVIAMGTPSGIGHARKPPRYLKPGQECRVAIEGIGELANIVQDDPEPVATAANPSTQAHLGGAK